MRPCSLSSQMSAMVICDIPLDLQRKFKYDCRLSFLGIGPPCLPSSTRSNLAISHCSTYLAQAGQRVAPSRDLARLTFPPSGSSSHIVGCAICMNKLKFGNMLRRTRLKAPHPDRPAGGDLGVTTPAGQLMFEACHSDRMPVTRHLRSDFVKNRLPPQPPGMCRQARAGALGCGWRGEVVGPSRCSQAGR
jgi:hypothetical protein